MKKTIWSIRIVFVLLFAGIASYIVAMETEKYESVATVLLKDLSEKQEVNLGSLLSGQGSEIVKDSKIMELYMGSYEMYDHLDAKYALSDYYVSENLDGYQRLYEDALLPAFRVNRENLLNAYSKDLFVTFDTISQTLELKFAHADRNLSQGILQDIIKFTSKTINIFSSESAKVSLSFINDLVKENRLLYIAEIKKLIVYQNKHHTIDPNLDVERKNTILAELEAD
ncbi:MAG: hypothetical protein U9R21_08165, partial [Candidatus Thermoplasmatota archaeon]|nr:hypothetical protein [Candidatus Thermoplasmatota archaeon]